MASDSVMFIGWNRPIAGRDEQALHLFETSIGYYSTLVKEKKIESYEPVLLAAHSGDLNGFFLLRGTQDQIDRLRHDEKFMDIVVEGQFCVENFGVVNGYIGGAMQPILQRWGKHSTKKK